MGVITLFKIITAIITTLTPFLIGFITYVNSLKNENNNLKLEYVTKENKQLEGVVKGISNKLDDIYMLMNKNNTAVQLLTDKTIRLEEDMRELKKEVYKK